MADPSDERVRFAGKLGTTGLVVRIIGVTVMVGSVLGVFVALNLRRADDRVGFSLMSMALLALGAIVWGSGMFHSAVARFLPSVLDVEAKLDALSHPKKTRRATQPQTGATLADSPAADGAEPHAAPATPPAETPADPAADALAQAGPTSTIPEPWASTAAAGTRVPPDSTPETVEDPSSAAAADAASAVSAEPDAASAPALEHAEQDAKLLELPRVPCPHCRGSIHPEASRCVHCMQRVERHVALPS